MNTQELITITTKAKQVMNIFTLIYEERAKLYKKMRFQYKKHKHIDRLLVINGREKRVIEILKKNTDSLKRKVAQANYELIKQNNGNKRYIHEMAQQLGIAEHYFDEIMIEQENFVNIEKELLEEAREKHVLSNHWKQAFKEFIKYIQLLQEKGEKIHHLGKQTFDPHKILDKTKYHLDSHKHKDIFEGTLYFVVVFILFNSGIDVIKEMNLDPIPPPEVWVRLLLIALFFAHLNIPNNIMNSRKRVTRKILHQIERISN